MTDDITQSTQYYVKFINRAILANLHHTQLKLGRLIHVVLQETHVDIEKISSHGNSLIFSPHPLDFNMLVVFQLEKSKQGHKLKLT